MMHKCYLKIDKHNTPLTAEATIQTFRVLMWKNYLIMRRKPIMVFCMTVVPACWSLLVFVAHSKSTMKTRMEFETFSPVPVNLCNHHIFSPLCQKGVVYTTYFTPDVLAARLIMQYTDTRMGRYIYSSIV